MIALTSSSPGLKVYRSKISRAESVCLSIGLKSTEMLTHVMPVGESILQGESNRLCSHKARGRVHNDSVRNLVSSVYILSIHSLEVGLNRPEELEHRHIEVMLINVQVWRQEPLVKRIRMKQIARGRTAGLKLLSFVDKHISSIRNLSAPVLHQADMRYFEAPRRRVRSAQSSKGKSLIYLSLVGCRRTTFWISFSKSWYLTRPVVIWSTAEPNPLAPQKRPHCRGTHQSAVPIDEILLTGP